MRRSASEMINNLETRIARLERQAGVFTLLSDSLAVLIAREGKKVPREEELSNMNAGSMRKISIESGRAAGEIFAEHLLQGRSIKIETLRLKNLGVGNIAIIARHGYFIGIDSIWQRGFRQGFRTSESVNDMVLGLHEEAANYEVSIPTSKELTEGIEFKVVGDAEDFELEISFKRRR